MDNQSTSDLEKNSTVENFQTLVELEREHFFKAVKLANGNKSKVASMLGITVKSVYNKLDKYYNETKQGDENE